MQEIFESTIERLLGDTVTAELLRTCETGAWPASLWASVEDSGFAVAAAPEARGGAGASWADLFVVVRAAGRHNLPLPLPETLLANALLGQSGLEALNEPLGIAAGGMLSLRRGRVGGTLRDIPWGRHVQRLVAVTDGPEPTVVLLDTTGARCQTRQNTAGEPRDDLHFDDVFPLSSAPLPAETPADVLQLGGALMRCAQIAGATQTVLDLATRYATERVNSASRLAPSRRCSSRWQSSPNTLAPPRSRRNVPSPSHLMQPAALLPCPSPRPRSVAPKPRAWRRRSRTQCMAPSALPMNMRCTCPRGGSGPGAANSAMPPPGRSALARPCAVPERRRCGQR